MGKVLALLGWTKDRLANLLSGVGSKRVAIIVLIGVALVKLEGLNANVIAGCLTLLGVAYIVSEMVMKLKAPTVPKARIPVAKPAPPKPAPAKPAQ